MKIAVKIAFMAAATIPAAASAQEAGRMLSLDEAVAVTLTENPALKAAAYEERAAQQQRRAAIGLRMPQINVTGAYAYMAKDIGFDFNDLKGPVKEGVAGGLTALVQNGLIPADKIPTLQGLLNPMMDADWFLKVQDQSLGFVGGEVTVPIWMGGKINAANRAARINEKTAVAQGNQTRNALISELVERYFGLALATQVVAVRQQVVDGVRRHLEDARALERNGMIAQTERLYVEFKMAEAERELANAKLQAETIASALSNTLGRESDWRPVTAMFLLAKVEDLAYYQDLAQARNPLLSQVSLKRATGPGGRARPACRLSCRRWWPSAAVRSTTTRWRDSCRAGPWAWGSTSRFSTVSTANTSTRPPSRPCAAWASCRTRPGRTSRCWWRNSTTR